HGPQEEKIKEVNPFVQLLWDKGVSHEKKVIKTIGQILDISQGSFDERFKTTIEAMKNGTSLIYQGIIMHENLLGIPDLLRKKEDGTYIPIDIKSGRGYEGVEESENEFEKLKKHYAIQLCLYQEVLQRLGFSKKNEGIIYDIDNKEIFYDLSLSRGVKNKQSWADFYHEVKSEAKKLLDNSVQNKPEIGGKCKLCPWYQSCKKWAKESHDLTNLFYVGRRDRNTINKDLGIEKIEEIEGIDIGEILRNKKLNKEYMKYLGENNLTKIIKRARIMNLTKKPVVYSLINLPKTSYQLFFDIEDDPTQGFVYLHGVYERSSKGERFIPFLAKNLSDEDERKSWSEFINYLKSLPQDDYSLYYYSHHEKTTYKKLQKKYPTVISEVNLLKIFENKNSIDLYSIVSKQTDWPLTSYSLKDIATYLGFKWRDETPSGALSIQWYNEYLKQKDEKIMDRILKYNEDDCKATMVLKDFLAKNNHA
ncbi:MAG: TM0106 family RecB-like putative nuclease, partial [Patescibacteria group bacterium]